MSIPANTHIWPPWVANKSPKIRTLAEDRSLNGLRRLAGERPRRRGEAARARPPCAGAARLAPLLTVVIALGSLALGVFLAIIASRTGGWKGVLVGLVLLFAWVGWLAVGPKP